MATLKNLNDNDSSVPVRASSSSAFANVRIETNDISSLTIKEAVVRVLNDMRLPMTAKDIYDKIVSQGLYSFGTKNPINVVRTTIEYACDNSSYTNRDAVSLFCYEKNSAGKRIYSLLEMDGAKNMKDDAPDADSAALRTLKHKLAAEVIHFPNGRKLSLHDVIDLDEAEIEMDNILHTHFAQFYEYSNKRLLFEAVKNALPIFLNDNGFKDEDTVLAVAKHLLGNRYVFYDLHIWQNEPNYPKSVSGLVIGFGRANGGQFTAEEAANYLRKVKIPQYLTNIIRINKGKEAFVLCDNGKIVLAECLNLSDGRVTAVFTELHKLFEEHGVKEAGFVIPRDISVEWFDRLPILELGLKWTPLLLQEIIVRYPERGFRVVFSGLTGQSIYTVASAFTIESSMLYAFADVVHLYLLRKHDFALPRKMPAEELRLILREAGMLAGNELIYNLHKVLGTDHRFAFTENNQTVFIRER